MRYSSVQFNVVNQYESLIQWIDNEGSPYFLVPDTPEMRSIIVMDDLWFFPPEWRVSRSYQNHVTPNGLIPLYRGDLMHANKTGGIDGDL